MDKIDKPYLLMLERLRILEQSIHILKLVNNDLRQILHKQKPLPQFIHDSFKRSTVNSSKTSSALNPPPPLPPPPTDTEEMRLAASIIDKAKRTIENVGEKKPKQSSTVVVAPPAPIPVQSNSTNNNRPKTTSSLRPSSASSSIPSSSSSSVPRQQQSQQTGRRYVPAHMKAPFLTQPEKKPRPSSSIRNNIQINPNQRTNTTRRSLSQQRRQSSTSQPIIEFSQQAIQIPVTTSTENENSSTIENQNINVTSQNIILPDHTSINTTTEEPTIISKETTETDIPSITQPVVLNRTLIKPLRRLWKQNQNLRSRLKREVEKKSTPLPPFIDRLNEQIHSSTTTDKIYLPNIEVLLQLAIKLRAIILCLLENSTFDDFNNALKRLNTLKYLVNQYHFLFTSNINIYVEKQHHRPLNVNMNIEEWLNKSKSSILNHNIIRYTDDNQLIALTEIRFKQFENECRWIELNWHEQMIVQFKQSVSNKNQNSLQIYRELLSLITGLQTATPIMIENKLE
ncbi:unnamed protein product [Adineta steineri]|uniref:Uncharacterized protein n=1 Tax=Adineta steineri TaxID=433720 RepID=A0A813TLE1_9BILA|nr:unnamed protein product [Adineta steineri]